MKDEEKVARLAAILGIDGAVEYRAYRGYGERSNRKGYRSAELGTHYKGAGRTNAEALADLVRYMVIIVEHEPLRVAGEADALRRSAEAARISESEARSRAEKHEAAASARESESQSLAAQFSLYCADCARSGE